MRAVGNPNVSQASGFLHEVMDNNSPRVSKLEHENIQLFSPHICETGETESLGLRSCRMMQLQHASTVTEGNTCTESSTGATATGSSATVANS